MTPQEQAARKLDGCPKCGGTHFGDVPGNCPLSADYVPSKPWPKPEAAQHDCEWQKKAIALESQLSQARSELIAVQSAYEQFVELKQREELRADRAELALSQAQAEIVRLQAIISLAALKEGE